MDMPHSVRDKSQSFAQFVLNQAYPGIITWLMEERGAHRWQVDGVVDVVEGHVEGLEGQHHALACFGASQLPLACPQ